MTRLLKPFATLFLAGGLLAYWLIPVTPHTFPPGREPMGPIGFMVPLSLAKVA